MEWRFSLEMKIKKIFKIGLFVITTSIFFVACSDKPTVEQKLEKPEVITINDVLNDSFEYDANQKLYKTKEGYVPSF